MTTFYAKKVASIKSSLYEHKGKELMCMEKLEQYRVDNLHIIIMKIIQTDHVNNQW